ncbi:hypothetical protein COO60DRAFT_1461322 [Scenedesmus sp. NREL 46B-D3]|nr:hypothetical protein COO60DRAFT_1461322 [Scenedesmus sp. NREL 46B-D3]
MAAMMVAEQRLAAAPSQDTRLGYVETKTTVRHLLEEQFAVQSGMSKQRWYNNAERPSRAVSAAVKAAAVRRTLIAAVLTDVGTMQRACWQAAAAAVTPTVLSSTAWVSTADVDAQLLNDVKLSCRQRLSTSGVLMISNLQQGRLFVREDLLQPQQLSGLPLRQTCLDTLAKEQGSIITAVVKDFGYIGVNRMHMHDSFALRVPIRYRVEQQRVDAGNIGHDESLHGALIIDVLRQAGGQPPINFTSCEMRAQVLGVINMSLPDLVERQASHMCDGNQRRFLAVVRSAAASGRIPELRDWARGGAELGGPGATGAGGGLGDLSALSGATQVGCLCGSRPLHAPALTERC